MGRTSKAENVYWNLHASYSNLKEYKKAYGVLSKYVNPFNLNTDYKEIYQLGMSASAVGKIREAVTFLKIARIKVPPTDTEYVQKIDKNLEILHRPESHPQSPEKTRTGDGPGKRGAELSRSGDRSWR